MDLNLLHLPFIGSSFICDHTGEVLHKASRNAREILVAEFDLEEIYKQRRSWGLFRDRRVDIYHPLLTKDGSTTSK